MVTAATVISIFCASLISALIIAVEHYLPWQKMLGRALPVIIRYVIGTAGFLLPFTALLAFWFVQDGGIGFYRTAAGLWSVAASSGIAVMGCYGLDGFLNHKLRAAESAEREAQLRGSLAAAVRGEDEPA